MSNVFRLRSSDRIFFVTACLHRSFQPLNEAEFPLVLKAFEDVRKRLGFVISGYELMPDHWHALLSTTHPLTISQSVQQVKQTSARRLNKYRTRTGPVWLHQFWDRFVRSKKEFAARLDYM
jgi:REP element-mobilizing transposase RayT